MPIYGNLFMCFILFELPIYPPLTGSFRHAPHSLPHPHQRYTIPPFHSIHTRRVRKVKIHHV